MLEQIGIDREIDKEIIYDILENEFKDCKFHFIEYLKNDDIPDYYNKDTIGFSIIQINSEFPNRIELYGFPDKNSEEREQYVAKIISDRLSCKTITSYTDKNNPDFAYYSIIFENGSAFLADDYDTAWADGEGGEVKVIGQINFQNHEFDNKGNKMGSS